VPESSIRRFDQVNIVIDDGGASADPQVSYERLAALSSAKQRDQRLAE
jgi:hypothetical protein